MIEGVALAGYRGAMAFAAGVAGVASRLPAAPSRWRRLRDRLGHLGVDERALASGAPALWLHAPAVGELGAARPLLRRLRERVPRRPAVRAAPPPARLEAAPP